jgi:hypothetical protein
MHECDCRWSFGLDIEFTNHSRVVTTNKYDTIANFHTLQITRAHAKSFPAHSAFTSSCLVMAPTAACFAFVLKSCLNGGSLATAYSRSSSPYNPLAWTTVENIVSNSTSTVAH